MVINNQLPQGNKIIKLHVKINQATWCLVACACGSGLMYGLPAASKAVIDKW